MKKLRLIIMSASLLIISQVGRAQTINWRSLESDQRYLINLNMGWDYSSSLGAAFGYRLKTKLPLVASASASIPFGSTLTDDWKTKVGGQAEVFRSGDFSATVKAFGVIREYQSSLVKMVNFGSELSVLAGYYKKRWFVAGEFGFDKAISTNIKNSDVRLQQYPMAKTGWYLPTGGNFFYGVQAGTSFGKTDLYLQVGKTISQDFKTAAALPVYLQLGVNIRLK